MNNFDYNRFKNVVRWEVLSNWSSLVRGTLGLAIGLSVYYLFILFTMKGATVLENTGPTIVVLSLVFAYMTINIFRKLKTKQYRISLFMLPASNLEKYLSRFLVVTIGAVMMNVCALLMADVVQMVLSLVVNPALTGSVTLEILNSFSLHDIINVATGYNATLTMLAYGYAFSGMLLTHSVFTLGGTIFHRHAVLLTAVISFFAGIFFLTWLAKMPSTISFEPANESQIEAGVALFSVLQLVLAIVFYGLSYGVFARMQVINNKWLNI